MRGEDLRQDGLFSYLSPEERVPKEHPLRTIRQMVDRALEELSPRLSALYSTVGRPSIPPERLLRALLLQVFYSVRSERLLIEQLQYNLLFRWFVGLSMDEAVWVPTVFTKNRDRLLDGEVAGAFFERVLAQARERDLLSDEHFTVDGTLIEAWASQRSFRPKGSDPGAPTTGEGDFRGASRSNATHASTTDPQARLMRKGAGKEARLSYHGHLLMENRHGLAVAARVTVASGTAECEAAVEMLETLRGQHRITLGADKGYDVGWLVEALRDLSVTPHVAQNTSRRRSAIDRRTTRHPGYGMSQTRRKLVETLFGWMKTVGGMRKTRLRGQPRVDWLFQLTTAAYNLVRLRNLQLAAAPR